MKKLVFVMAFAWLFAINSMAGPVEDAAEQIKVKRYTEARELLEPLAKGGDPKAQGHLARLYNNGWGVKQDLVYARELAKRSAAQGSAEGANVLGSYHYYVRREFDEAIRLFLVGANKGYAPAQFNLGEIYQEPLIQDHEQSLKWYRLAAAQGNDVAMLRLAVMYARGYGVAKDFDEAERWLKKAKDVGDIDGEKDLQETRALVANEAKTFAAEKTRKGTLRSAKYSQAKAELRVETRTTQRGGFTFQSVRVTSVDNEPLLIERVVINNRVKVDGCEFSDIAMLMRTGDVKEFIPSDKCGDAIVRVQVETNRGTFRVGG